jgi:hypothetical protein
MASGEIRLSTTMLRQMPVLAQGQFGGGGASGSWDDDPGAILDSWSRPPITIPTFPGLNDPDYFTDIGSAASVTGASAAGGAWSAGLDGGMNPAFWSGPGAYETASGLGTTMADTPVGGWLADLSPSFIRTGLTAAGSATFAFNAAMNGSATAVISSQGTFWSWIEAPILTFFRTSIYFVPPL